MDTPWRQVAPLRYAKHAYYDLLDMSPEEIREKYGAREQIYATPPRQDKIDHFVVLYMENHAADHYFGCMGLPGFDGIEPGHSFPVDPDDPSKGIVNVTCGNATYVCAAGPSYLRRADISLRRIAATPRPRRG